MERTFFDIASDLESELCNLEQAACTYNLVLDVLEYEGFQDTAAFDERKAQTFARRFPAFLPTLFLVHRDLEQRTERMNELVRELYKMREAG